MSQVLRPGEVEYMFRAVRTDLGCVLNRLKSLENHFDEGIITGLSADLSGAILEVTRASGKVLAAEKLALRKSFPHREHAGELD